MEQTKSKTPQERFRVLQPEDCTPLLAWWHWLDDNRGDRARLRRAETPEDILLSPAFAHFLQQMPDGRWPSPQLPISDCALVAAALARVKQSRQGVSFARSLAKPRQAGEGRAAMSELRFQQLQKSRDPDEFFRRLCRAIALLGHEANLLSLADGILHWLLEHRTQVDREPLKRLTVRWASEYYAALKD